MAVKPLTQPLYWATDPVYSTGPFIGQPQKVTPPLAYAAEGHRPGANFPTPAEYENSQQYNLTGLARWVFAGSSAGAADAHVVETDSTGRATLQALTVNNAAGTAPVLATGTSAALPVYRATNTAGGNAFRADLGGSTGSALSSDLTGSSIGVNLTQAGNAVSILIAAGVSATQDCISILQSGAGRGINVQGGPGNTAIEATAGAAQIAGDFIANLTSIHALRAIGGTLRAVYGVGQGNGLGGEFLGGATATTGALGTGGSATAYGVHGRTANGAGSSAAGVFGEGRGAGSSGVRGENQQGYAFFFQGDTTSPAYPTGRFVPQNADPTASTNDGDFTFGVQNQIRYCVAGFGYKPVMSMPTTGSAVLGIGVQSVIPLAVGSTFVTVCTASCLASQGNGFYSSSFGHIVRIRFSAEIRSTVAVTTNYAFLQFQDNTTGLGTPIQTWTGNGTGPFAGFQMAAATTGWQRCIVAETNYSPTADGNLIIRAQMNRDAAMNNFEIRNARLEVIGSF